tara:strand:+ start:442 stop:618 length:177 start_codon:yes stop_codon:yes gene_type:complete
MQTHNTCVPDADQALGDFDLISKLLIAIQVSVGLFGILTIYQLRSSHKKLEDAIKSTA